jgi:hypothetical protein
VERAAEHRIGLTEIASYFGPDLTGSPHLPKQGDRDKIEPEANAFASELLIPSDALRRELHTPQTISALAPLSGEPPSRRVRRAVGSPGKSPRSLNAGTRSAVLRK